MDTADIVVSILFAVFVAVIVVMEVRSTQRMNAFIKAQKSPSIKLKDDDAEEIVSMFLEWCRTDPHRLKNELAYMQESVEGVTLETHTH